MLQSFINNQCKDVKRLLNSALKKYRLSDKINEKRYQEFMACQKFERIIADVERSVKEKDLQINLQILGHRYEANQYMAVCMLHIFITKSGKTLIEAVGIQPVM